MQPNVHMQAASGRFIEGNDNPSGEIIDVLGWVSWLRGAERAEGQGVGNKLFLYEGFEMEQGCVRKVQLYPCRRASTAGSDT